MGHFAHVNAQGIVDNVIVAEPEFIATLPDKDSWVQTSYNGNIRTRYAGLGMTYDKERDAFIPAQPYPSWILNETTLDWEAPVPKPEEGVWSWDEALIEWVQK